jgi:hypothetical protein
MSPGDYGLVLVFLAAGLSLGWYANKAYASHGDVKTGKGRVKGYRKSRHRNGIIAIILAIVIGVVVLDLMRPPH